MAESKQCTVSFEEVRWAEDLAEAQELRVEVQPTPVVHTINRVRFAALGSVRAQ